MNKISLLNRARKELERAETLAADDAKAAHFARQVARAAKIKLKKARKLAKLTRKSARKAEDKSEQSAEVLDRAQTKLEKLEKRLKKEQGRRKSVQSVRRLKQLKKPKTASSKRKPARKKNGLPRRWPKSKPAKTVKAASPRVRRPVTRKTAKPAPVVAPEPKLVPTPGGKPGDLNPPATPEADAPSSDSDEPA